MNESESNPTTILGLVRWLGWAQMKAGEDWIRERDLSHAQAFALGYLVQNPGAIQRDLAEITRTSAASVSSLLQGLERRGLVERRTDPENERTKRAYETCRVALIVEAVVHTWSRRITLTSCRAKSRHPVVKASGIAAGFDSLTSRSLSLRPSRPCRGFPSRSILDSSRNDLNV